ncbi:MAG: glycosyltransferase [Anaerolineales bacterium]|nr:MAG: glycosyltransferase [Anaerolineales bacterium]
MRIAMIGPFGLRPRGTMRVRALPLARELVALGHAVKMVMPPWHTPEEAPRKWNDAGVDLEYVALGPGLSPLSHLVVTLRLVRCALAWEPDVVHCFKPKAYAGFAAWVLWRMRGLRTTKARLVVDADDWEGPGGWNDLQSYPRRLCKLFAWQERWGLGHSDAVTVASRTLQSLVWSLGVTPTKVHYLPNGGGHPGPGDGSKVRDRLALGQAPVVLLYTRFFEYDPERVVAVFCQVLSQVPDARLLVVGEALFPEDGARFDRAVAKAGLGDNVARAGWVPQEELADYFAASDVAIYPFDDTLVNRAKCAVKLVDLLAAGVAVVADAVGQNAEYIVHEETGLLVPSGDVCAMAAQVVHLLRDRARRRTLASAAALRISERYSWPVLARSALAAYGAAGAGT